MSKTSGTSVHTRDRSSHLSKGQCGTAPSRRFSGLHQPRVDASSLQVQRTTGLSSWSDKSTQGRPTQAPLSKASLYRATSKPSPRVCTRGSRMPTSASEGRRGRRGFQPLRAARPSAPAPTPHPASRARSRIRRTSRSCSAEKPRPRRRRQPRPARVARGSSPRAGSRASPPPSG